MTRNMHAYMLPCYIQSPELHADLFSRHASPLEVYVFVAVANRGEDVMSDEILSSIQWKAGIKEAEWPKCAAPRLVYDSVLRDTYARIRTYYVRLNVFGENKRHPLEVRSRDRHTCRTCVQKFRSISYKTSWTYEVSNFLRKTCVF